MSLCSCISPQQNIVQLCGEQIVTLKYTIRNSFFKRNDHIMYSSTTKTKLFDLHFVTRGKTLEKIRRLIVSQTSGGLLGRTDFAAVSVRLWEAFHELRSEISCRTVQLSRQMEPSGPFS